MVAMGLLCISSNGLRGRESVLEEQRHHLGIIFRGDVRRGLQFHPKTDPNSYLSGMAVAM